MKYGRGFLMAWGCFCWIPCPYHKWNEEARTAMVAMLPLVGTGLGMITCLVWAAMGEFNVSPVLTGAVVTASYFVMTGFIHLDGFMDVCDAVMPRHPRQEERIRILKDPHTGSFAMVSAALMFLVFAGSVTELTKDFGYCVSLIMIVVLTTSRGISAMTVIGSRPMPTSQYAASGFGTDRALWKALPALLIMLLVLQGAGIMCFVIMEEYGLVAAGYCLIAAAVTMITELIIGHIDRRSLGGMNGDISGHMIVSGEMAGLLAAALVIL